MKTKKIVYYAVCADCDFKTPYETEGSLVEDAAQKHAKDNPRHQVTISYVLPREDDVTPDEG